MKPQNNTCGTNCETCKNCESNQVGMDNVLIYIPGDVFIHASLPITKTSSTGAICGEWSWEGIQTAEAFRYAIQTAKTRYSNVLPSINIGVIVTDSCKDYMNQKLNPTMDCNITVSTGLDEETTSINPSHIASKVVFADGTKNDENEVRPRVVISSFGVSFSNIKYDRHYEAAVHFLKSRNWTYVNVFMSQNQHDEQSYTEFIAQLKSNGLCVSRTIKISSNQSKLVEDIASLAARKEKSSLFIFTADVFDTKKAYSLIEQHAQSFHDMTFVTFPWNYQSIKNPNIILIHSKEMLDVNVSNHLKSLTPSMIQNDPLWIRYHEDKYKCSFEITKSMVYPTGCEDIPTFYPSDAVSPWATQAKLAADSSLLMLDQLYKTTCQTDVSKCPEWYKNSDYLPKFEDIEVRYGINKVPFSDTGELLLDIEVLRVQAMNSTSPVKQVTYFIYEYT